MRRICVLIFFFIIYIFIAQYSFEIIDLLFNNNKNKSGQIRNSLVVNTIVWLIYITHSGFNWVSYILTISCSKFVKSFKSFILRSLILFIVSYTICYLLTSVLSGNDYARLIYDPVYSRSDSLFFYSNFVVSTILFYVWFLPLWYYRINDWFWNRGKYVKMD